MTTTPTGAPRSWDPDAHYVQVSRDAVAEVGLTDAYVFALLKFRTTKSGEWAATMSDVAAEIGMPFATVRKALERLRDRGYVVSTRKSAHSSTLTWSIQWADDRPKTGHLFL